MFNLDIDDTTDIIAVYLLNLLKSSILLFYILLITNNY